MEHQLHHKSHVDYRRTYNRSTKTNHNLKSFWSRKISELTHWSRHCLTFKFGLLNLVKHPSWHCSTLIKSWLLCTFLGMSACLLIIVTVAFQYRYIYRRPCSIHCNYLHIEKTGRYLLVLAGQGGCLRNSLITPTLYCLLEHYIIYASIWSSLERAEKGNLFMTRRHANKITERIIIRQCKIPITPTNCWEYKVSNSSQKSLIGIEDITFLSLELILQSLKVPYFKQPK